MTKQIAIISGSLRKASYSTRLAKVLAGLFPSGYNTELINIGDLPLYNQDYDTEGNPPEFYTSFREQIADKDAVVFVTPEYNRSVPAALKNALDVGSRPFGHSVWSGKPALVVSNSPGNLGGFGANHHLRQTLTLLNMPTVQQPEAYIGNVVNFLGENDDPSPDNKVYLQSLVNAFTGLVEQTAGKN